MDVVVGAAPILLPVGDGDVMWAFGAAAPRSNRPDDVRFCRCCKYSGGGCTNNIMVLWMSLLRLRKEDVRTRMGAENGHHFKYNDVCCIIIIMTPTIHRLTNSKLPMLDHTLERTNDVPIHSSALQKNKLNQNSERSRLRRSTVLNDLCLGIGTWYRYVLTSNSSLVVPKIFPSKNPHTFRTKT
jgi:hypothetical protein